MIFGRILCGIIIAGSMNASFNTSGQDRTSRAAVAVRIAAGRKVMHDMAKDPDMSASQQQQSFELETRMIERAESSVAGAPDQSTVLPQNVVRRTIDGRSFLKRGRSVAMVEPAKPEKPKLRSLTEGLEFVHDNRAWKTWYKDIVQENDRRMRSYEEKMRKYEMDMAFYRAKS